MLAPNAVLVPRILLSVLSPEACGLLAYGPAPGLELIPYFLALLGWVGLAFLAVLLAPFSALLRRIRRARETAQSELKTTPLSKSSDEGRDPG